MLPKRGSVSSVFLLCGYMFALFLEYSSLHFVLTPEGYWRVEAVNSPSIWITIFALAAVSLSILPAFFFVPALLKNRKSIGLGLDEGVSIRELINYFAFYQISYGLIFFLYIFLPTPSDGSIRGILQGAFSQMAMLLVAFMLFRGRMSELGFIKPRKWIVMVAAIALFYLFNQYLLDDWVTLPLSEWLHFEVDSWREQQISGEVLIAKSLSFFTGITDVVMVGLFVPVAEEVMFRGVLQTALAQRFGAIIAILGSSVLFAVIHADPVYLAPLFVMSLMLGWLRYYFNSIWAAILFHGVNNSLSILFYYFQ